MQLLVSQKFYNQMDVSLESNGCKPWFLRKLSLGISSKKKEPENLPLLSMRMEAATNEHSMPFLYRENGPLVFKGMNLLYLFPGIFKMVISNEHLFLKCSHVSEQRRKKRKMVRRFPMISFINFAVRQIEASKSLTQVDKIGTFSERMELDNWQGNLPTFLYQQM